MEVHIHDAVIDPGCSECTGIARRLSDAAEERRSILHRINAGEFDHPAALTPELWDRCIRAWYAEEMTKLLELEEVIGPEVPDEQ